MDRNACFYHQCDLGKKFIAASQIQCCDGLDVETPGVDNTGTDGPIV